MRRCFIGILQPGHAAPPAAALLSSSQLYAKPQKKPTPAFVLKNERRSPRKPLREASGPRASSSLMSARGDASTIQQFRSRIQGAASVSITVEDFHKTYGETVAVAGITFTIGPGEVAGLVGP